MHLIKLNLATINYVMKKLLILCLLVFTFTGTVNATSWLNKLQNMFNTVQSPQSSETQLSNLEIGSALKETLQIGVTKVINNLGRENAFYNDPDIHIPLPGILAKLSSALSGLGMSSLTDELELKLNRAAEAAVPKAQELFIKTIKEMSIIDAKNILVGENDSATQYLHQNMGVELSNSIKPIVSQMMMNTGALSAYESVTEKYSKIPFMPNIQTNINDYVTNKTLEGIFHYVAKEEAAIRKNPAKEASALIQKVFLNNYRY